MQITLEIAHDALSRRIIAKGDVHVAVDQAGDRDASRGIDDNVASGNGTGCDSADLGYSAILHQDAIACCERAPEVAGQDGADFNDRRLHRRSS